MSSSPTKRYYDSKPSSRPTSPQSAADVRSQAVAKLKRAASLPRKPTLRRPSNQNAEASTSSSAAGTPERSYDHSYEQPSYTPPGSASGSGFRRIGDEEILTGSPLPSHFTRDNSQSSLPAHMQRSASSSSSSHLPTPPYLHPSHSHSQSSSPMFGGSTSPPVDWAAVQLGQSMFPSLSPVALGHSPYTNPAFQSVGAAVGVGRNTPSPLPTLGELRTIQRSNSTAARARALDKLTGGRETPSLPTQEPPAQETPTRPGLQRADSLGSRTHQQENNPAIALSQSTSRAEHPPSAFHEPRPRLQRSFTVSSSNMGEERRSAVGRRMVARLAERAAEKKAEIDAEQAEVRRLWEERTGRAGEADDGLVVDEGVVEGDEHEVIEDEVSQNRHETPVHRHEQDPEREVEQEGHEMGDDSLQDAEEDEEEGERALVPSLIRHSPVDNTLQGRAPSKASGLLPPEDDRPGSRNTQMSEGDAFEYASHLSRSLSARTARTAKGTIPEVAPISGASHLDPAHAHVNPAVRGTSFDDARESIMQRLDSSSSDQHHGQQPHQPQQYRIGEEEQYDTPIKSQVHSIASSQGVHKQSPGSDAMSTDALNSMMFVMGSRGSAAQGTERQASNGFPIGVEDAAGSDWGTPNQEQLNSYIDGSVEGGAHMNAARSQNAVSSRGSTDPDNLSPPGLSTRTSVMSWEEVGGEGDREVPSDTNYHKKSGSITAKVGRAVTAMRKRSQSRSSTGSASIHSPQSGPAQLPPAGGPSAYPRRGSESSVSPSQASVARSWAARGSPKVGYERDGGDASGQGGVFNSMSDIRHQPSMSSLSPSLQNSTPVESSANSMLLQHQLANDPQPIREMPRARMDDPRVYNSKLSPFPGVERRGSAGPESAASLGSAASSNLGLGPGLSSTGGGGADLPKLLHQHSDSAVPSAQRVTPTQQEIHSLPLVTPPEEHAPTLSQIRAAKRGSEDSTNTKDGNKRSWLAKTFGSATSPRTSGSASRKSSLSDLKSGAGGATAMATTSPPGSSAGGAMAFGRGHGRKLSADVHPTFALPSQPVQDDIFGSPLLGVGTVSGGGSSGGGVIARSRPISPSVSTVAELNEDGHRLTQFTAFQRSANHTPVYEEDEGKRVAAGLVNRNVAGKVVEKQQQESGRKSEEAARLSDKSVAVLKRMEDRLMLGPEDPTRPDVLDDPPRKLLLATQVLQVVNSHTAKDRFLFLFNDILVICKPVITHGGRATLDMKFTVKSIVSLDKLHAAGFTEDPRALSVGNAASKQFIEHFAEEPSGACQSLIERRQWKSNDIVTSLAAVLFNSPDLDKVQLGLLLAAPAHSTLLRAFIDMFQFGGTRIDDALRIFLLSLALPGDSNSAETLLSGFARGCHAANEDSIGASYPADLSVELVLAMIQLSDALHGNTFGFSMRNKGLTPDVWISAFRSKDPKGRVRDGLMVEIYKSVESNPLLAPITSLDGDDGAADEGRQVEFDPGIFPNRLSFDTWSEEIVLRIPERDDQFGIHLMGDGLEFEPARLDFASDNEARFRVRGTKLGSRTVLFARIGENAPMYASLGNARIITIERAFMKHTFHVAFANHIGVKRKYCFSVPDSSLRSKWGTTLPRQIDAARKRVQSQSASAKTAVRSAAESVALHVLRDALIPQPELTSSGRPKFERTGSVSVAYAHGAGKAEEEMLGPLVAPIIGSKSASTGHGVSGSGQDHTSAQVAQSEKLVKREHGMMDETTGKEVVLVCRQNSLLPDMLELLQAGAGAPLGGGIGVSGGDGGHAMGHSHGQSWDLRGGQRL